MVPLVAVAAALAVAGAAVGAVGAIQQGQAAEDLADFESDQARQEAQRAWAQAAADEQASRARARRFFATQQAAAAKSGLAPVGSPLEVFADSAAEAEINALSIRAGGAVEAARLQRQGEIRQFEGRQAKRASFFRAGATLLGGGARAASIGASGGLFAGGEGGAAA